MKLQSQHLIRLQQKGLTQKDLAEVFELSIRTIRRKIKPNNRILQQTGRKSKINGNNLKLLKSYLDKNIDTTQQEVADYLLKQANLVVSQQAISRTLHKHEITHKKITYQYSEREGQEIDTAVWKYSGMIKQYEPPNNLLSLDECSFRLNFAPHFGYSLKGLRAKSKKPGKRGKNYTLILCIQNLNGKAVIHYELMEGGMKTKDFHKFISELELPTDKKHYLLLDNLRVHHATESCRKLKLSTIKELATSKNIELVYSVPYDPELNPTELCFNIIKGYVKKQRPRTFEQLKYYIDKAINDLQQEDLFKYFRHSFEKMDCLESLVQSLDDKAKKGIMERRAKAKINIEKMVANLTASYQQKADKHFE